MWRWLLVVVLVACGGGSAKVCPGGLDDIISPDCSKVDCRAATCDETCAMGTTCALLDCTASPQCRLDCQPDATCTLIDCRQSDVCFIDCHGAGSTCEVECQGAAQCDVNCHEGAECLLHCGGATSPACALDTCTGGSGMLDCGNGVVACNRPCP